MTSALCRTNGSCICPDPNRSPTVFIPASRVSLTMSRAGRSIEGLVEVGLEPGALTVDDAPLEPLEERQRGQLLCAGLATPLLLRAVEELEEALERVVALAPRSCTRSRATWYCSSGMRAIGRIFEACTIAESSPALMHSARNTELSTCRAAGFRPKETLDRPSVVCTSGNSRLTSRMAAIVSMPSRRVSSWPVAIGNVRQSRMTSSRCMPHLPVRSSMSRVATRTFHSAVRAWPSSSIVSAMTAAPCSLTSGMMRAIRLVGPSPSS